MDMGRYCWPNPTQQQMDPTHDIWTGVPNPAQPKFDSNIRYTVQISTNFNNYNLQSKGEQSKTK